MKINYRWCLLSAIMTAMTHLDMLSVYLLTITIYFTFILYWKCARFLGCTAWHSDCKTDGFIQIGQVVPEISIAKNKQTTELYIHWTYIHRYIYIQCWTKSGPFLLTSAMFHKTNDNIMIPLLIPKVYIKVDALFMSCAVFTL